MYKVIDLFSGAGGLSQGFTQAGFDIKSAFEKDEAASETYRVNFPNVELYGNVIDAKYDALKEKYGPIDVVIGGPPCQGFSNANRQHNQAISLNNKLVKEFVRAILDIRPKAFVMENVGMLKSATHRFFMEESDAGFAEEYKIPFSADTILLLPADMDFPEAKDIAESPKQWADLAWDDMDFQCIRILNRQRNNPNKLKAALLKYKKPLAELAKKITETPCKFLYVQQEYQHFVEALRYYDITNDVSIRLRPSVAFIFAFQKMLQRLDEIESNSIIVDKVSYNDKNDLLAHVRSCAVSDYIYRILQSDQIGYTITSGIMNAAEFGVPQKRMRFIIIGIQKALCKEQIEMPKPKKEYEDPKHYQTVYKAIYDLAAVPASQDRNAPAIRLDHYVFEGNPIARSLRDSEYLYNHFCTATQETAKERFAALKEGQNFHDLSDELKTTYTDATRTQNTIYLRLTYDQPSGTVINVRKSMWIHPTEDRALTVREAARLQSFPDHFRFTGTKDQQYQQVGNAVPPLLAEAIADHVREMLDKTGENIESNE